MVEDLEQLREVARELGNSRLEQHAHYYLAQHYHWIGDEDKAERHARRAQEIDGQRFADVARHESALLVAAHPGISRPLRGRTHRDRSAPGEAWTIGFSCSPRPLCRVGQMVWTMVRTPVWTPVWDADSGTPQKAGDLIPHEDALCSMVDLATHPEYDRRCLASS